MIANLQIPPADAALADVVPPILDPNELAVESEVTRDIEYYKSPEFTAALLAHFKRARDKAIREQQTA